MISRTARRTNSQIALFAVAVQPDPKIKARLVELGGTVLALSLDNADRDVRLYQIPLIRTRGPIGAVRWT